MPHVSAKTLPDKTRFALEQKLFSAFAEGTPGNKKRALNELFTTTEKVMLAKRLEMLFLITRGTPTHRISHLLNVSPSTVARFEVACETGKYKHIQAWFGSKRFSSRVLHTLLQLTTIPFTASPLYRKTFKKAD